MILSHRSFLGNNYSSNVKSYDRARSTRSLHSSNEILVVDSHNEFGQTSSVKDLELLVVLEDDIDVVQFLSYHSWMRGRSKASGKKSSNRIVVDKARPHSETMELKRFVS